MKVNIEKIVRILFVHILFLITQISFAQWSFDPTKVLRINSGQIVAMASNTADHQH